MSRNTENESDRLKKDQTTEEPVEETTENAAGETEQSGDDPSPEEKAAAADDAGEPEETEEPGSAAEEETAADGAEEVEASDGTGGTDADTEEEPEDGEPGEAEDAVNAGDDETPEEPEAAPVHRKQSNKQKRREAKEAQKAGNHSKKEDPFKAAERGNGKKKKSEGGLGQKLFGSRRAKRTWGIVILVAFLCVLVAVVLVKKGVFDDSNYKYLHYDKYITLGKYEGLKYKKPNPTVTDDELKEEINSRVAAKATEKSVKSGTVKDGDTITISYVGTINGKQFDGGTASDVDIEIGSDTMIPGFEDGLVGKKIGSKVTLNLTFPSDYQDSDLAGKDAVFTVTINAKKVTVTPEYNLDFVKRYTKYDSIEAYEKSVRNSLLKDKKDEAYNTIKSNMWKKIIKTSKVKKYPERQLDYEQRTVRKQYNTLASNYGTTLKAYLKQNNMTMKQFNKSTRQYAKEAVRQKLCLYALADKLDVKLSDSEYKSELLKMLKNAGYDEKSFEEQYSMSIEEYAEQNDFYTSLLLDKVLKKVLKLGKAS